MITRKTLLLFFLFVVLWLAAEVSDRNYAIVHGLLDRLLAEGTRTDPTLTESAITDYVRCMSELKIMAWALRLIALVVAIFGLKSRLFTPLFSSVLMLAILLDRVFREAL